MSPRDLTAACVYIQYVPAGPTVKVLDTSGAGDSFLGSFSFFTAASLPVDKAAARACRIATVSVTASGTQTSYPSRDALPAELFEGVA
jgi:ribokinase